MYSTRHFQGAFVQQIGITDGAVFVLYNDIYKSFGGWLKVYKMICIIFELV